MAARLADAGTRFAPVWRGRNLVAERAPGQPEAVLAPRAELPAFRDAAACLLGVTGEQAIFAVDLSPYDDPLAPAGAAYEELWRVGGLLPAEQATLLGHARAMMHWHGRQRFCGVCGAACAAENAGHTLRCGGCGAVHFPRTDPAVIMLVTRGERALLARSKRFRNLRMFSTLAGFVEPGESLEEAVAREVLEEAGVRVAGVRYAASQPWPFPASLMLGFRAEAVTDAISLDDDELIEADWFLRDALRQPDGFQLPPAFSIAGRLIADWLDEG